MSQKRNTWHPGVWWFLTVVAMFTAACFSAWSQEAVKQLTWRFDDTASLGVHATKLLGHPKVIETSMGKAITFNGVDDALFAGVHPLAGAETWTWEMIFKPDADGGAEQRIFHLQSIDPATGRMCRKRGCCLRFGFEMGNGVWIALPLRVGRARRC